MFPAHTLRKDRKTCVSHGKDQTLLGDVRLARSNALVEKLNSTTTNPVAQMRHAPIRYLAPYCNEARTSSSVSESSTVTGDSSPLWLASSQEALPAPPLLPRPVVVASAVSREAADDDTGGSGDGIGSNEWWAVVGKRSHDPRGVP